MEVMCSVMNISEYSEILNACFFKRNQVWRITRRNHILLEISQVIALCVCTILGVIKQLYLPAILLFFIFIFIYFKCEDANKKKEERNFNCFFRLRDLGEVFELQERLMQSRVAKASVLEDGSLHIQREKEEDIAVLFSESIREKILNLKERKLDFSWLDKEVALFASYFNIGIEYE